MLQKKKRKERKLHKEQHKMGKRIIFFISHSCNCGIYFSAGIIQFLTRHLQFIIAVYGPVDKQFAIIFPLTPF